VEANSTGGQGSRRAVAPNDDDDDDDWAVDNPRELHERPLHSPPVTVWCAIAEFGV
jgi:hypothetical protein